MEENVEMAKARKTIKYADLVTDLSGLGWKAKTITLEIGVRGHINKRNRETMFKLFGAIPNKKKIMEQASKIALLCSYSIYHASRQLSWTPPPLLHP